MAARPEARKEGKVFLNQHFKFTALLRSPIRCRHSMETSAEMEVRTFPDLNKCSNKTTPVLRNYLKNVAFDPWSLSRVLEQ